MKILDEGCVRIHRRIHSPGLCGRYLSPLHLSDTSPFDLIVKARRGKQIGLVAWFLPLDKLSCAGRLFFEDLQVALIVGATVSEIDQVVTTEGGVPLGVQGCELVKEHTMILVHQHGVILVQIAEKGLIVEHGLH